ncbi:MAG: sigma-54 dependent transcriptional regulator [Candidatus Omnitrophica bacterium]|nr:sigma-54 dependent transcriptional regulator [Candidatus Omnitrophota bacterium]
MKKILVVDDEIGVRESLRFAFQEIYEVKLASSGKEAVELIKTQGPEAVILDLVLPDVGGLEVLKTIRSFNERLPVIILTAHGSLRFAVEAMRLGAVDFLTKPFDIEEMRLTLERVLREKRLKTQVEILQAEVQKEYPVENVVFKSKAMGEILSLAKQVAGSDSTVLLLGPSGCGKELVARAIHAWSTRREEAFVPIHCAAIPETLFESEIFGYEKGAFTNAFQRKPGKIELAGAGTIFFDEVSEIPPATQVKLLRFLQEKEYSRLGGNEVLKSEARIVAASARDLKEQVSRGLFREDLYYRLCVVPLMIPPLKERPEDIEVLLDYYLGQLKQKLSAVTDGFTTQAKKQLLSYSWPGNVRELRNVVERMLVLYGHQEEIGLECLPEEIRCQQELPGGLRETVEAYEKRLIADALEKCGWNQNQTARLLKTTRRIIRYKAEKYGLRRQEKNGPSENFGN